MFGISLSCQPYSNRYPAQNYYSYVPSQTVLTERMLIDYGISSANLLRLAYFLSQRLVLRSVSVERQGQVTAYGTLLLQDSHALEDLVFPAQYRGYAVTVWQERTLPFFRQITKIGISFDPQSAQYLTFSPDMSGRYQLETSWLGSRVNYGGQDYDCVQGCSGTYLMVPAQTYQSEYQTTGIPASGMQPVYYPRQRNGVR